ncbi:hypothetical protein I6F65_09735 [Pseudoalteromonas sp. SWXJZ94C]|uniref:hypothetical protein n=1 Tax=Pseudoalteromonas sp. SWXJZ94C TaxID=2792065 RepID=UPI0018CDE97B|nr:hypothetical protein [Pseudoalteromonas sp. SWXJZ94C]MBH0057244.1 hypothetical protein [Pseudoalteromonas sp. SWXJZ94C]
MADILWRIVDLGSNVGILFTWFILIAFLYNLSASINKVDKSRVHLSLIMLVSYISSLFMDTSTATPHLNYFYYDFVTIGILLLWLFAYEKTVPTAFYYLIVGLSINAFLFLGMHYDIVIAETRYYWWFWTVYVFGMYFIDFTMALVLIINKDLLKLVWLIKKLKPSFVTKTN